MLREGYGEALMRRAMRDDSVEAGSHQVRTPARPTNTTADAFCQFTFPPSLAALHDQSDVLRIEISQRSHGLRLCFLFTFSSRAVPLSTRCIKEFKFLAGVDADAWLSPTRRALQIRDFDSQLQNMIYTSKGSIGSDEIKTRHF